MRNALPIVLLFTFALPAQEPASQLRKDLSAAVTRKDPAARVKAVDQFLARKDVPPALAAAARNELVGSLAKDAPKRAVKWVERASKRLKPADRAALYQRLAATLLETKQLPAQALIAARRAAAVDEARPRSRYQETLGMALHASGLNAEASVELDAVLKENPGSFRAADALASIAEAEGRTGDLLPLRAQSFLARASRESWDRLRAAYGDRPGLEEYLDARYAAMYPLTSHPEPYQPGAQRSERTVLAELYTGAGCPPCAAADVAFDSVLERYARRDVAVVMYHVHVPRPDPMTNSDTRARWDWQKGRGVPTYAIDGRAAIGGGARADAPEVLKGIIEKIDPALEKPAGAALDVHARHHGASVAVRASLGNLPAGNANLRLKLVLVEKQLRYSGENGIRFHPMVARNIVSLELNGAGSIEHSFDLAGVEAELKRHLDEFEKHDERHNKEGDFRFRVRMDRIDPANLAVVGYVQDMETREVLQSAFADAPLAQRTAR